MNERSLNEIKSILDFYTCAYSASTINPLLFDEVADLIYSLPKLKQIIRTYEENPGQDDWKHLARQFFAKRAELTMNTPLCITLNNEYRINKVCLILAEQIAPNAKFSILLPDVDPDDIVGNSFDDTEQTAMGDGSQPIKLGEFILADNKRQFIHLPTLVDHACTRITAMHPDVYLLWDVTTQAYRPLSENEKQRGNPIIPGLFQLNELVIEKVHASQGANTFPIDLLDKLRELKHALQRGSTNRRIGGEGAEYDSGEQGNIGIVAFMEYFNALPADIQRRIMHLQDRNHNSFAEFLRNVARESGTNYQSVRYCMGSSWRRLDEIIDDNASLLQGVSITVNSIINGTADEPGFKRKTLESINRGDLLKTSHVEEVELENQIQKIELAIQQNIGATTAATDNLASLNSLIRFLITEVYNLENSDDGYVRGYKKDRFYSNVMVAYTNLLIAAGQTSIHFVTSNPAEQQAVLNEIYDRISTISKSYNSYLGNMLNFWGTEKSASQSRWEAFCRENATELQSLTNAAPTVASAHFDNYLTDYPLTEQREIHAVNIAAPTAIVASV